MFQFSMKPLLSGSKKKFKKAWCKADIEGGTQAEGVWEQGAEESILT
jgi:hypothetical protein